MLSKELVIIVFFGSLCGGVFGMECKCTTLGTEYTGKKNTTANGIPCQKWNVQTPHLPCSQCTGPENYCRNPDDGPLGPWCYTMDPNIRWAYCDIPYCNGFGANQECKYTQLGTEYQGKRSTTRSGIPCRQWQASGSGQNWLDNGCPANYCRNPDNSPEGPWCLTVDPNVYREYCDIPYCNTQNVVRKTCRNKHKNYDGELLGESVADSQLVCISRCLSTQQCSAAVFDRTQSKCLLKKERIGGTFFADLQYDTFFLSCNIEDCN